MGGFKKIDVSEIPENVGDFGMKAVLLYGMFDLDAVLSVSDAEV